MEMCESIVISRGLASTIKTFCSDTRVLKKEDMFISLKSETEDGIKYIEEAFEKGAMGCITEYNIPDKILEKNKFEPSYLYEFSEGKKVLLPCFEISPKGIVLSENRRSYVG